MNKKLFLLLCLSFVQSVNAARGTPWTANDHDQTIESWNKNFLDLNPEGELVLNTEIQDMLEREIRGSLNALASQTDAQVIEWALEQFAGRTNKRYGLQLCDKSLRLYLRRAVGSNVNYPAVQVFIHSILKHVRATISPLQKELEQIEAHHKLVRDTEEAALKALHDHVPHHWPRVKPSDAAVADLISSLKSSSVYPDQLDPSYREGHALCDHCVKHK
jgi:hypothetical protein